MRTCLGITLRSSETNVLEATSTKVVARPMAMAFMVELVTASTGQETQQHDEYRVLLPQSAQESIQCYCLLLIG